MPLAAVKSPLPTPSSVTVFRLSGRDFLRILTIQGGGESTDNRGREQHRRHQQAGTAHRTRSFRQVTFISSVGGIGLVLIPCFGVRWPGAATGSTELLANRPPFSFDGLDPIDDRLSRRWPISRVLGQQSSHEVVQRRRHARVQIPKRTRSVQRQGCQHGHDAIPSERLHACTKAVQDAAQAEQVRFRPLPSRAACSGDMYAGVPTIAPDCVIGTSLCSARAWPKSRILTRPWRARARCSRA